MQNEEFTIAAADDHAATQNAYSIHRQNQRPPDRFPAGGRISRTRFAFANATAMKAVAAIIVIVKQLSSCGSNFPLPCRNADSPAAFKYNQTRRIS